MSWIRNLMGWDVTRRRDVSRMIQHSYQVFDAIARCETMDVGAAFRIPDQTVSDYIVLACQDGV